SLSQLILTNDTIIKFHNLSGYFSSNRAYTTKTRLTQFERAQFKLTPYLKEVLVGLILGDLYMRRHSPTANARLQFRQGFLNHAYLSYLYNLFIVYVKQGISYSVLGSWSTPRNLPRISVSFATMALPCFNYYYDLFYKNGKKVIPEIIGELLTFVSLAFWIMDDGHYMANGGIRLSTDSYTHREVLLLQKAMVDNFGINPTLQLKVKSKGQYVIYIPKGDVDKIRPFLVPHMHASMMYKLGL
nr:hypothetical protein 242 - Allomyces macrogynus mitochondrion [Allomyces macrogynus]